MHKARKFVNAAALLAVCLLPGGPALAQSAADFFQGKTITLMVSAPAGSLTDLVAREFRDHFAKHVPGHPDVVVSNVAGAGGMMAAARLQLQEPRDGTVIGFLQRNNLYRSLVENDARGFDPREVSWIGSLDKVAYVLAVSGKAPVKTPDGIFTTRLILGATGVSNDNRALPELMNRYMGAKFRIIHGYDARGEVYLAMERGEVDGWASTIDGLRQGDQVRMLRTGELVPLVHMGWTSHPDFPDLPNFSDYVTDPSAKAAIDFFIRPFEAGRPIAVPKGLPPDRLEAIRAAFDATVTDPEFRSAMARRNWPVDPISGTEVEAIRDMIYATPEETLTAVREILAPPRR